MRAPFFSIAVRAAQPGRRVGSGDVVSTVLAEITAGRLPAGGRLPPVRALERQLGLSKNTVQAAYDELVARGALETREREGVFVRAMPEGAASVASGAKPPPATFAPSLGVSPT